MTNSLFLRIYIENFNDSCQKLPHFLIRSHFSKAFVLDFMIFKKTVVDPKYIKFKAKKMTHLKFLDPYSFGVSIWWRPFVNEVMDFSEWCWRCSW